MPRRCVYPSDPLVYYMIATTHPEHASIHPPSLHTNLLKQSVYMLVNGCTTKLFFHNDFCFNKYSTQICNCVKNKLNIFSEMLVISIHTLFLGIHSFQYVLTYI